jgi:hypothetical protein
MIDGLLDTNILIDLARQNPAASAWLGDQGSRRFALPVLVAMEMAQGTRSNEELRQVQNILRNYPIVHLTAADSVWALEQHARFWLSHNIGMYDALIAAVSIRLRSPIYTLNLKHFQALPDVKAIRPY